MAETCFVESADHTRIAYEVVGNWKDAERIYEFMEWSTPEVIPLHKKLKA